MKHLLRLSQAMLIVLLAVLLAFFIGQLSSGGAQPAVFTGWSAPGKILTLLLLAAALGTDAMSLAIGLGLRGITRREGFQVSMVIGLFHIIMPLVGTAGGMYFSQRAGGIARIIGAAIVAVIGLRMIWGCLRAEGKEEERLQLTGFSLLILAFCVSVDALSVGLGLGAFGYNVWFTSLLFGIFGAGMTALGLFLGIKMFTFAGKYGELLGGGVLVVLALKMFWEG